jgi:hypothetical protein
MRNVYDSNIGPLTLHETPAVETWINPFPAMRKINSASGFNIILNEAIAGGLPRLDGRPGCMIAVRPGVNMVPDQILEDPFFKKFVTAGQVTVSADHPT